MEHRLKGLPVRERQWECQESHQRQLWPTCRMPWPGCAVESTAACDDSMQTQCVDALARFRDPKAPLVARCARSPCLMPQGHRHSRHVLSAHWHALRLASPPLRTREAGTPSRGPQPRASQARDRVLTDLVGGHRHLTLPVALLRLVRHSRPGTHPPTPRQLSKNSSATACVVLRAMAVPPLLVPSRALPCADRHPC